MKRFLLAAAFLPTFAHAAIDYTTFDARVVLTRDQIRAFTGQSTASLQTLAVGADGRLYIYSRTGAADPNAKLLAVDVSGPSPSFTTIATEADLLPFMDSVGPHVFNLNVDAAGVVYFQEYVLTGQIDDILRIVPGVTPTVTNVRNINGIAGVKLNRAGDQLYITQVDNFLAPTNDFVRRPVTGGVDTIVATSFGITSVSGGAQGGISCAPAETAAGNFLVWDEAAYNGSDSLLQITPSGVVTVVRSAANWNGGIQGGVIALGIDGSDTLFAWDQNPSAGGIQLHVIPDAGTGTPILHSRTSINDALTLAVGSFYSYTMHNFGNGMAVHSTPTQSIVYLADVNRGDIVSLTFNQGAPASNSGLWALYE